MILDFLKEFLKIYFGLVWQKTHCPFKWSCQNKPKGVFAKHVLEPKKPLSKYLPNKQDLT
jgi:hypothetical protein